MMIKLYTTHCPQCEVLTRKLNTLKMSYDVCDNIAEIEQKGFASVPILEVDGKNMTFMEAVRWLNSYER